MIEVVEEDEIWEYVANCKCRIPISLGYCHTLAAAKKYRMRPLFLRPERELVENQDAIAEWLGIAPLYLSEAQPRHG